jgi:phenylalanyl-tRNA synthetase beta chain
MSMPPIINSHKTGKVTEETRDLFIECTGNNLGFLKKALNIMVTALSDMGGKVYAMEIQDGKEKYLSPNLEPEKFLFSIDNVNKLIGLDLKEKDIIKYLEKMGLGYEKEKEESFALIPAYRNDILHEVDIAEDIAIAYGFENLNPEIPKISTIGEEDSISVLKRKIAEVLAGLKLLEISTYHLSTKEKQFKNIGVKDFKDDLIEVIDSKTENNVLRVSLLSQSIEILSENPDSAYPQRIFELGRVFSNDKNSETGISEKEKLCISLCHEKTNFTEIKQALDYLMRMLNIKYEIKESEHPSFIPGRCGEIIINKNPIGFIGEICPFILHNNKIKMPVASLEMEIEKLLA